MKTIIASITPVHLVAIELFAPLVNVLDNSEFSSVVIRMWEEKKGEGERERHKITQKIYLWRRA